MNRKDSLYQLEQFRRRLASNEKPDALRHLASQVDELRWVAPESVLGTIGDFVDRINDKLERCTPAPTKATARK